MQHDVHDEVEADRAEHVGAELLSEHRGEREDAEATEGEHPPHDDEHGVGHAAEEPKLRESRAIGDAAQRERIEQREEHHGQQRAVGRRLDGIERNERQDERAHREGVRRRYVDLCRGAQARGGRGVEHERFEPHTRHHAREHRASDEQQEHPAECLRTHRARLPQIVTAGHADDEQRHHQRNHRHAHGIDPCGANDIEGGEQPRGEYRGGGLVG